MANAEQQLSLALAKAAGLAEGAASAVAEVALEVTVPLGSLDFSDALATELRAVRSRLAQIHVDLHNLAHSSDGRGFGDELYRLTNRGAERPDAKADRDQLEAIEGARAAA